VPSGDFEIFLKLDGIDGESADKQHAKEIDVLSYSDGLSQTAATPVGSGGASAGRPTFMSVHFRKAIDKASVPLLLACAAGQHVKDALFTFRRTGTGAEFYKVKLTDVLVTAVAQVAGTGEQYPLSFKALDVGADRAGLLDEVTLDYGKIEWEYQPVGPDGKPRGAVKGGWDLRRNTKI
jgi:type VI secretion system secreted protein Hcp